MCIFNLFSFSCLSLKVYDLYHAKQNEVIIYIYMNCVLLNIAYTFDKKWIDWMHTWEKKIIIQSLENNETCDCWNVKYEILDNKFPSKKNWPFFLPSIISYFILYYLKWWKIKIPIINLRLMFLCFHRWFVHSP